jgi:broad specificity phosphatase PhoE
VDQYPIEYAITQTHLGDAYSFLAEVRDKENNAQNAIVAHKSALEVFTIEKYPIDYARTQNNLGNAYLTLAEVKEKEKMHKMRLLHIKML